MTFPPPNPAQINTVPSAPALIDEREWVQHVTPAIATDLNDERALAFRLLYRYGNRLRYFSENDSIYFCDPDTNLWTPVPRAAAMLADRLIEDLEREERYLDAINPTEALAVAQTRARLSNRLGAREAVGRAALLLDNPYLRSIGHQALHTKPGDFFTDEASNEITLQDARVRMTEDGIELLPAARPQDGFVRSLPYTADAVLNSGDPEMYLQSLNMFMPDQDVREFFMLRLGTNVLGKSHKRGLLILLYGTGRNGKTTIIRAALLSLGDYAAPQQGLDFFVTHPRKHVNTDHMTFAYGLDGKRAASHGHEVESGAMLFESNLKNAIPMQAMDQRKMRENERIRLDLQASFYMAANTRPRVEKADRATRRRFACIAMSTSVDAYVDQMNDYAEEIFKQEGAKVAGLQIRQACAYLRASEGGKAKPIHIPQKIQDATEDWFSSIDPIAEFYAEYMRPSSKQEVSYEQIYAAYTTYHGSLHGGSTWLAPLSPELVLAHLDRAKYPRGKKGRITDETGTRRVQYVKGRLLSTAAANACLPYDDEYEWLWQEKLENTLTQLGIETDADSEQYWEVHDELRVRFPQSFFEAQLLEEALDSPAV